MQLHSVRRLPVLILGLVALGAATLLTVQQGHTQSECAPRNINNARVWETDFCQSNIDIASEVRWGGVPRDGIPPIDNPEFESIEDASEWLRDRSPVISFELDGDARAYPLAILTRHEIVNDRFGETPVAVTFCPLCNSAIVFERQINDTELRLGVSGYLRNSDLIMWDDQTESWWQQLTGEGIVGEFTGEQLTILPSQVVSFEAFREQFPDGVVLDDGNRSYGINPYTGYDSTDRPFLFDGQVDDRLDSATDRVLAGTIGGQPIAYPFDALAEEQVINDTVGDEPVVAIWQPGKASALDQAVIAESRDVGMATLYSRVIEAPADVDELDVDDDGNTVLTFIIDDEGVIRDEQTNSTWDIFGTAEDGPLADVELRQELAAPHFWFAWAAFEPETLVYGIDD
jgi:hypothetical protein